jgi:hypothetical protein
MNLTRKQKKELIDLLKTVDVKKLEVDVKDKNIVKWFRFGSYNGLQIAIEIIKAIKEGEDEETDKSVKKQRV